VLLLGCTHYPLLRPLLRRLVPAEVTIVDSAESTAHAVAEKLEVAGSKVETRNTKLHFFATDSVEKFRRLGERFLGCRIENVQHVDIDV
jgi:glutamate racemase